MTDDPFDGPGSTSAIKFADHENRLVLIWARGVSQHTYNGETKEVIEADVVVLDPLAGPPIEYKNTVIFAKMMQGQIRGNIGRNRPNLGRVAKGQAKAGQSPPWILTDPTDADKRLGTAYMTNPNAVPAPPSSSTSDSGGAPPF